MHRAIFAVEGFECESEMEMFEFMSRIVRLLDFGGLGQMISFLGYQMKCEISSNNNFGKIPL